MIIIGLLWQFILSLLILYQDGHPFDWSTFRIRLKFQGPKSLSTGQSNNWLLCWTLPFIFLSGIISGGIGFPDLDKFMLPLFEKLPKYDLSTLALTEYKGAWWLLILFLITFVFNYFLGEELIYRGILLPKMNGVFGKWDWVANGVLFGIYHLHKPQVIISTALLYGFIFAYPAKKFQSTWMSLIIHGLEGILGLVMILSVVLGMA